MKKAIAWILSLAFVFCMLPVSASAARPEAVAAADALHELGLFQGVGTNADGTPIYALDRTVTRHEAVTMLVRLLGKETEALAGHWETPFTDVAQWAEPYVGYAYANGLTTGTSATTYSGKQTMTATQYLTFLLRALDYSSKTDFQWNRAWTFSDSIGLTGGEYTAANNAHFLRGDVAILSNDALDIKPKGSEQTLRELLTGSVPPPPPSALTPGDYLDRQYTDSQLAAMKDEPPASLRAKLSSLEDVVALMDLWQGSFASGSATGCQLSPDAAYQRSHGSGRFDAEIYTAIAGYLISDDFDGIQCVIATVVDNNITWGLTALCLPTDKGYFIISPFSLSTRDRNNNNATTVKTTETAQLTKLQDTLIPDSVGRNDAIRQVYLAKAGQTLLQFTANGDFLTLSGGRAQEVYRISDQAIAETEAKKREQAWNTLTANWAGYGIPADAKGLSLSRAEAEALVGKDIGTVAAAVKSLEDCIYYYCAAGFRSTGGDLTTSNGANSDLFWHYNYDPQTVFRHNYGCCGSISGLTAYLLEGDYDTTGIAGMTFAAGEGGGHVINYVKHGASYYFFDMINLISSNYSNYGFNFVSGSSLQGAANRWMAVSPWNERLMYAYQSFDGDAPVGWDRSNVSYLSNRYKQGAVVLLETPAAGYVYQWVDIDAPVWSAIRTNRSDR